MLFQMLILVLYWPYTSPYFLAVCCLHTSRASHKEKLCLWSIFSVQSAEKWIIQREWTEKIVFRLLLYLNVKVVIVQVYIL